MKTHQAIDEIVKAISYLVENDKISKQSARAWENRINTLIQGINTTEAYIFNIEEEKQELLSKIQSLQYHVLSLEAICFIHGITNLAMYLAKGPQILKNMADSAIAEGWAQIPAEILSNVKQS